MNDRMDRKRHTGYADHQCRAEPSAGAPAFQKVAESLEDTLRAGRVPVTMIKGTMDAVSKAGKFLERVAAAGKVSCSGDSPLAGAPPADQLPATLQ